MTGKERLDIIIAKMKRRGVTRAHASIDWDAVKAKGLTDDQVYDGIAQMYEAAYNGDTRPARPLFDGYGLKKDANKFWIKYQWQRNLRSWIKYQWACLLNPFRVWKIRRDNARAEKASQD